MSRQTSLALALAVGVCAGAGCGGGNDANVITGTTSGGSVHLAIDDSGGSGVEGSHVPATLITVVAQDPTSGAVDVFLGGYVDAGGGFSTKQWQIQFAVASAPAAGNVYSIVSQVTGTLPPTDAVMSFEEDDNRLADWVGDSGTISVASLVGTVATFTVSMVDLAPTSGEATGPFTFNGQMVVDLSNLCNCSD